MLARLREHEIDYCFSVGAHLLTGDILKEYKNAIIGFHPSLLPAYKGFGAIDAAVSDGAFLLGNTAFFVDDSVDGGPVIMQNVWSTRVLRERGYPGILETQNAILYKIYWILNNRKLRVLSDGEVFIEGADYTKGYIFPSISEE